MNAQKNTAGTSVKGPPTKRVAPAADIGIIGMLRWAWRQLTTMRAALILLLVLALAAIPGSLLPQRIQDPGAVSTFIEENGTWGEFLDTVQLFDVYTSVWFSAVYILLMVSLVGCIIPRTKHHLQAMRQAPPKAPRRLTRMSAYRTTPLAAEAEPRTADELLDRAQEQLKKSGYRTVRADDHVAAERGYLKETGNLVFHVSVLAIVLVMAAGGLFGYSGQRVIVEGDTFTNSLVSYDSFEPGTFFDADSMPDFRLTLDEFDMQFDAQAQGAQFGQPRVFDAYVTLTHEDESTQLMFRPNEPVRVDGSRVYLLGNGYAPVVTVRNQQGDVTFNGPVVFLPQDGANLSNGVIKVPDVGAEQLGLVGTFLPTAEQNQNDQLYSSFAGLENPLLVLALYEGDLGLDSGAPQSVYELNTDNMEQIVESDGSEAQMLLRPGETAEIPGGRGTISLDEVRKFVGVDIRYDPTQIWMLPFTVLLIGGLSLSLFVPRRRLWVRVVDHEIEVAGLARGEDPRLYEAVDELVNALSLEPEAPEPTPNRSGK